MGAPQALIRDLYGKIDDIAPERRALALRHLTDLFLVGAEQYSAADIALIDDIFVRLIESIDDSARALLAIRLGPVAKAPPKLLHRLACDDLIDVASTVLTQSEGLDDATLVECAVTKSQDHMLAISQRKTLSEMVTDVLVECGDRDVVLSTARNAGARFSKNGYGILVYIAEIIVFCGKVKFACRKLTNRQNKRQPFLQKCGRFGIRGNFRYRLAL